jgi:hypothetical protein
MENRRQMMRSLFPSNKKGNLAVPFYAAIGVVLALVVLSVIFVVGFNITDNMKSGTCTGTGYYWNSTSAACMYMNNLTNVSQGYHYSGPNSYNATVTTQSGLNSMTSNISLWVIVVGAAITLTILFVGLGAFMYMKNQGE